MGVSAQQKIEASAALDPPDKQPGRPKSDSQGKTKPPEGKGPKRSRTKKGAWGEETAGAEADAGDFIFGEGAAADG